jgi:hypothetical protein
LAGPAVAHGESVGQSRRDPEQRQNQQYRRNQGQQDDYRGHAQNCLKRGQDLAGSRSEQAGVVLQQVELLEIIGTFEVLDGVYTADQRRGPSPDI